MARTDGIGMPSMNAALDWLSEVERAWDASDFETAMQLVRPWAEAGDPNAMNYLAIIHECGLVASVDFDAAAYWYKRAWMLERDYCAGENLAGMFWKMGKTAKAYFWINKLIGQGNPSAMLVKAHWLISRSDSILTRKKSLARALRAIAAEPPRYISEAEEEDAAALIRRLRRALEEPRRVSRPSPG